LGKVLDQVLDNIDFLIKKASIAGHLVMQRSAGLFQRAIMESGPFVNWDAQ
jgi:hypothetical protein